MRRYTIHPTPEQPRPFTVELHVLGCDCAACEPYRPSVAPRLTAVDIARQALVAVAVGHLLAALIWGPHVVAHVLWADLTGAQL